MGTGCAGTTDFIGGAQAGANYRNGNWLLGIESDISGLSNKKAVRFANGAFPDVPATGTTMVTSSVPWLATIRSRFGALINENTLVYVTGGLAVAQIDGSVANTFFNADGSFRGNSFGSDSAVVPGWAAGAGAEWKVGGNWSLKTQYLHVDLRSVNFNTTYAQVGFTPFTENLAVRSRLDLFRIGANYRLGDHAVATERIPSPVHNWTGAYAGIHFGGASGNSSATDVNGYNAVCDVFNARTSGVTGGVQAGYNWQWNKVVAGVEGDIGYLGANGSAVSRIASDTFVNATGGAYGTLRGRIGAASDRALFYATGDLMVARIRAGVDDDVAAFPANLLQPLQLIDTARSGAQAGWTLGAGIEYAFTNVWSIKGEYLYHDLGTQRVTGIQANTFNLGNNLPYAFDIRNTGNIVRMGFNRQL